MKIIKIITIILLACLSMTAFGQRRRHGPIVPNTPSTRQLVKKNLAKQKILVEWQTSASNTLFNANSKLSCVERDVLNYKYSASFQDINNLKRLEKHYRDILRKERKQ